MFVGLIYWLYSVLRGLRAVGQSTTLAALVQYGLGKQYSFNTVLGFGSAASTTAFFTTIMLVNLPQVGLAILAQILRTQVCTMILTADWCVFSCGRKSRSRSESHLKQAYNKTLNLLGRKQGDWVALDNTGDTLPRPGHSRNISSTIIEQELIHHEPRGRHLRVSYPEGDQEGPYFFSMPWEYALFLLAFTTCLHWLFSQGLFYSQLVIFYARGVVKPEALKFLSTSDNVLDGEGTKLVYSPLAVVLIVFVWLVFLVVFLLMGFKALPSGDGAMPMVSTCSLAISAACHPPKIWTNLGQQRLTWGSVSCSGPIDQRWTCCLTSAEHEDVRVPQQGKEYGIDVVDQLCRYCRQPQVR